jgi:hypothetical protein
MILNTLRDLLKFQTKVSLNDLATFSETSPRVVLAEVLLNDHLLEFTEDGFIIDEHVKSDLREQLLSTGKYYTSKYYDIERKQLVLHHAPECYHLQEKDPNTGVWYIPDTSEKRKLLTDYGFVDLDNTELDDRLWNCVVKCS